MINKLRVRFISVAMFSVFLVLAIMLGAINIVNSVQVINKADNTLERISQFSSEENNNGIGNINSQTQEQPNDKMQEPMMRERFFVANIDENNKIIVDTSRADWVTENDAIILAQNVFNKKEHKGSIGIIDFCFHKMVKQYGF